MYFATALNKNIATVKDLTISSYAGGIESHKLEEAVYKFTNLEVLYISGDFLELSPLIANLKNLRTLSISSKILKKLPKEIGALSKLESLSLSVDNLEAFPEEISALSKLKSICIWRSDKIKSIPESFSKLPNLNCLDVYRSSITDLNAFHKGFPTLNLLSISECRLKDEHLAPIFKLSQLQSLNLSDNAIQTIPSAITQLKQLHSLALDKNQIEKIPTFLVQLKELRSIFFNENQVAQFPAFLKKLAHLGKIGWNNNPLGQFDKHLLSFPIEVTNPYTKSAEVKRYRALMEQIKACDFSDTTLTLFADIKAGRALKSGYSRANFVALNQYNHTSFRSLVLEKLVDYEKALFEQQPLNKDSKVVIIGKTSLPKTEIKRFLKENGIPYEAKVSPKTTHLIVGSTGIKDLHIFDNPNYILISQQAFQNYINDITKPYLLENENKESHQHIASLLLSQDPENQALGIELLKGGGTPTDLLTELFVVFKFSTDKKLATKAKKLLATHGSSALVEAIKLRINLRTVTESYNTADKIERLCAGNELDAWKVAQFAYRHKPDIWHPKIPLGLQNAPEKQAIDFLKEAVPQKTRNDIYSIKKDMMPYIHLLYEHCGFLKGLEFDHVNSKSKGIVQLKQLETLGIRFMDNVELPEGLPLLPLLKNIHLTSVTVPDWQPVLEQLAQIKSLEHLNLWSTMKEGFHPDILKLQQLKELELWNIALNKKDLILLSQLSNLESLIVNSSYEELHDDFLVLTNISKLTFNKELQKRQNKSLWVTKNLHQLKNLKSLNFNGPLGLYDDFNRCSQLTELYIQTNYNRPRPILASNIKDLVHLERLTIRGDASNLETVLPNFQALEHLELYHQKMDQDLLLAILKKLPKLKTFNRWLGKDLQKFETELPHVQINKK